MTSLDREIHLNSPYSTFNNQLKKAALLSRIEDQFEFFTKSYFMSRTKCFINLFLMGHGVEGAFTLDCNQLYYSDLVAHIFKCAEKKAKAIGQLDDIRRK